MAEYSPSTHIPDLSRKHTYPDAAVLGNSHDTLYIDSFISRTLEHIGQRADGHFKHL